jgi:uncharacterized RDD family membrane protein YckC
LFPEELRAPSPAYSPVPPAPPAPPYAAAPATSFGSSAVAALNDYAGFWKRLAAYILDALVLYIPNTILSNMLGASKAAEAYVQAKIAAGDDPHLVLQALDTYMNALWPALIAQTLLAWLYFGLCESSAWQGTVGKLALGIRVTDMDGKRISFMRATGRYFGKIVSAMMLCFGFLMIAWTRQKQGFHDMLAKTLVLNGRARDVATTTHRTDSGNSDSSFNA